MSAIELKKAGLLHFAQHGYDGTSLSLIAKEVGIKKQSIYSHFANKDELYLSILDEVIEDEKKYILNYFVQHKNLDFRTKLFQFLTDYSKRYEKEASMKFLLRNGFLPPSHLHEQIVKALYFYFDDIERIFIDNFQGDQALLSVPATDVAISYIALIDSVLIELLYSGNERFQRRLNACWTIFWQGISRQEYENNE